MVLLKQNVALPKKNLRSLWNAYCSRTRGNSAQQALMVTFQTDDMTDLVEIVRSEYREMPGLRLTRRQAQRLWNLDSTTCEAILDVLESTRFLRRISDQSYVLDARAQ